MSERAERSNFSRRRMVSGIGALGLGLVAMPTAIAARQATPQASDPVAMEVEAAELARIEALLAHDAEAVGMLTADDFEFITPLGDAIGYDFFIGGIASGMIDNQVHEPVGPIRVRLYDDAAALRYQAHAELAVGGDQFDLDLWFTALYEFRDGGWKIVWLQVTELPADQ